MNPAQLSAAFSALAPAADWIDPYRAMWEKRLDRPDAYLRSVTPASATKVRGTTPRKKPKPNTPGERIGRRK